MEVEGENVEVIAADEHAAENMMSNGANQKKVGFILQTIHACISKNEMDSSIHFYLFLPSSMQWLALRELKPQCKKLSILSLVEDIQPPSPLLRLLPNT